MYFGSDVGGGPLLFLAPMLFLAIAGSLRDFFRVVGGAALWSFL